MATLKTAQSTIANKGDYTGEHVLRTHYSSNTTVSAGDVVYCGRLPSGVIVTGVVIIPGAACANGILKVGVSSSADVFIASATASAGLALTASKAGAIGYVFSASDAATIRYENIIVTPTAGVTAGRWFDLIVKYVNNDNG